MAFFRKRLPKYDPEKQEQKLQQISEEELSWKDKLAMVLSAYLVILLPVMLVLIGLMLLCMWAFGII